MSNPLKKLFFDKNHSLMRKNFLEHITLYVETTIFRKQALFTTLDW